MYVVCRGEGTIHNSILNARVRSINVRVRFFVHFRVFIAHLLRGGETVAQPIQAVQIYYEHPFGAEREVLREFFSFVGCLVKTTMMPVETMLEKHKSLANPESEQITHLFLTDRPPEGIVLSKNEMWCSFRITMIFDATFRQPLIYTVSYMLTHQDEMKSMGEDKLLSLLQDSIAKQKE